jgi:hypothetical protein
MSSQVVKFSNFSVDNIKLAAPRKLDNGGKMIYLNYDGKPLNMMCPKMSLPFGISDFTDEKTGTKKFHIDLSFRGMEDNEELAQFHSSLTELDEFMKEQASKNSTKWFGGKAKSAEVIEELYAPVLKKSKNKETGEPDGKYPDTFKAKLMYDNETSEFRCSLFDMSTREEITTPPDMYLSKGTTIKAIVRCNGVWFAGGRFGPSFRLEQAKVQAPSGRLTGYAFDDDDDEENLDDAQEEVVHSDGEDENDDASDNGDAPNDDTPPSSPSPPPTPKKKVVRRRGGKKNV